MAVHVNLSASAEDVASINDLLIQILLRLPVKSLLQFKLVSKHWKSLITSPHFSMLRNSIPNSAVGLIYPLRKISTFEHVCLNTKNPIKALFRKLSFPEEPCAAFWIQQSCNGLLLCCSSGSSLLYPIRICYVYNPTTNHFTKLPRPGVLNHVPRIVHGVNLAFDCTKSPPYKAVCVRGSELARELFQIEIYSPESGVWRVSGEPFAADSCFDYGVNWNGSIHWISYSTQELLYFDVDRESLGRMRLPIVLLHGKRSVAYFGESRDHLHIIGRNYGRIEFDVYEIKRDYSEWFVKYRVDLAVLVVDYPEVLSMSPFMNKFSIFSLVRGEEENSFLVLRVGDKVVRLKLGCESFEEICDIGDAVDEPWLPHAFDYFESLACVSR